MAKLQVYKFVSPGAGRSSAPEVAAARQSLLATNRLGSVITGIGSQVVDINKITNLRVKAADRSEIAERREKRKQMDAEAEALQESVAGKKNLSEYFKKKSKIKYKKKDFGSFLKKTFGIIGKALQPLVDLFIKIGALAIMNDLLKWVEDENNIKALTTFLERASFVFEKIFNFGAWIVKDNLLDGFDQLFGSDSSFLGRVEGLGKMMVGIIGLKYLFNPFSIITDIIAMANIISAASFFGGKRGCLPNSRFKNRSRFRPKVTTSKGASTGPFKGVREFFNKLKPKAKITQSGSSPSLVKRFTDLFKKKPIVSQSGATKGNFISNLFNRSKVTTNKTVTPNVNTPKPNFNKPKVNFNKPNIKFKPKITGNTVKTLGLSLALDWALSSTFGAIEQKQFENYIKKFEGMSKEQQLKEIQKRERIRDKATQNTKGFKGIFNKIITGGGFLQENQDEKQIELQTTYLKAMYQIAGQTDTTAMNQNEYKQFYDNVPEENKDKDKNSFDKLNPANDRKWYNPFSWFKAEGGQLPELFIGGLVRSIGRAVSGVVKGVTSVVSSVVNTVSNVISNPIVNTALSFIPGVGPVVQAINAVTNLAQGNIMGAITSGVGALGSFANINTVNAINQPQWMRNLRFSKFGQGVANMYHKGANLFARASGFVSNLYNNVTSSRLGKIGMQLLGGNMGGAIGEVVGMMPGLSGGIENFGNWLEKNQLQGILGAVPGIRGLVSNVPNIMSIPGMAKILGGDGYQFSAMNAIGAVADKAGMKGIYTAIMSGVQSGNYVDSLRDLAPELGVDPRILGVLDKGRALLRDNKFNAEYAMQTAIEFLPVPLIVEKLIPAPTPVPINSGDTYLVAPSSTQSR